MSEYVIKNDVQADEAILKIASFERKKEEFKEYYEAQKKSALEELDGKIEYYKSKLAEYFSNDEILKKETKTTLRYNLPSGELVMKKPAKDYKVDEDKLLEQLERFDMQDYIKTTKTARWGDLKKGIAVVSGKVVFKETGEIFDSIEVVDKAPEFKVSVKV